MKSNIKIYLAKTFLIVFGVFCLGGGLMVMGDEVFTFSIITGMIFLVCGIFTRFIIKHRVPIAVASSGITFVALLVVFQIDSAYLYDVSILHSILFYIVAAVIAVVTLVALIVRKHSFKKIIAIINILGIFVFFLYLILNDLFCFWVSASKTNDIANYKKFDTQVWSSDESFFPDLKDNYEVIKYDYYYSYPYHHVYSIYLEIKVDGDINELLDAYRTGEYEERPFKYNDSFMEISFDDEFDYSEENDKIYYGEIRKILYSAKDKTVIFQCFESWSFCRPDEVYYFERFGIAPKGYEEKTAVK